ncbi:MAG: TSUP family transporter, partial [Deferrisomatales bacterium]|nr:TSUP family transporter [Deferrisomatales bacterium]
MDGAWVYPLLFGAGLVAGTINVVAGGGSFLTLPVLIFVGLPPTIANATNRVGVLLQNVGAVWGFHRHGVLDWRSVAWAAFPAALGSLLGTWAALRVGDEAFQRILAFLMIAVTLWSLWNPLRGRAAKGGGGLRVGLLAAGFF